MIPDRTKARPRPAALLCRSRRRRACRRGAGGPVRGTGARPPKETPAPPAPSAAPLGGRCRCAIPPPATAAPPPPDQAVMAAREAAQERGHRSKSCARSWTASRAARCARPQSGSFSRDGNPQARLMFVGEAPGREEDIEGLPFVGRPASCSTGCWKRSGSTARRSISPISCPGARRETATPSLHETSICLPFILRQIELVDPKVLVCLGRPSTATLLGVTDGIRKTRGRWLGYRNRHARDPRDADIPSGLSFALAAGEAICVARLPRDQEGVGGLAPSVALPRENCSIIPRPRI